VPLLLARVVAPLFFWGRSMGVSVASIKTTSKTWPLAATAVRPGNRKVLLRASVFSHASLFHLRRFDGNGNLPALDGNRSPMLVTD
jgi:hypothetical protein